ncbi:hypothetical protein [Yinghuangia sp. YIM S09857]|uniref:hypothetical protein n=1 Tax=Yinghuangia sp. YIM S09857 TaxID=3436929 RepID=UPI003F5323CD
MGNGGQGESLHHLVERQQGVPLRPCLLQHGNHRGLHAPRVLRIVEGVLLQHGKRVPGSELVVRKAAAVHRLELDGNRVIDGAGDQIVRVLLEFTGRHLDACSAAEDPVDGVGGEAESTQQAKRVLDVLGLAGPDPPARRGCQVAHRLRRVPALQRGEQHRPGVIAIGDGGSQNPRGERRMSKAEV